MVPFELFGQAWVLFRDAEGRPACVRDECAHRACPLSLGRVVEGQLECPYHGVCARVCEGGLLGPGAGKDIKAGRRSAHAGPHTRARACATCQQPRRRLRAADAGRAAARSRPRPHRLALQ